MSIDLISRTIQVQTNVYVAFTAGAVIGKANRLGAGQHDVDTIAGLEIITV